ncbi:MAG: hypothetical protein CTY19_18595 [Methylomonas sp.]|jgi:hypothetical protein|nr:MAG: hypothetical protein CTY19_18595 [Methylomonas sp.]
MISNPKNDFERLFGSYPEGHCFEIENCQAHKKINNKAKSKDEGLKIAEFLLLDASGDKTTISIVEAKSSAPRDFDAYIDEVKDKLSNSLSLFLAVYLQRHKDTEISDLFKNVDISGVDFKMILVIQNYPDSLDHLQVKLKNSIKKTARIWNVDLNSVLVMNEAGARRHGLIREIAA